MEDKKYELLKDDCIKLRGVKLYKIRALKDFKGILKGTIGGYIEKEDNLSQEDNCWVFQDAEVHGNARVYGNAAVFENAAVCESAVVCGNTTVFGKAEVYGKAEVRGYAAVFENAKVYGGAAVFGSAEVYGKAEVRGYAMLYGKVTICGNATISNETDYIVFKNNWSSGRYFIWTRSNDMWSVGCFYGNGKELIEKAYEDSKLSGDMYKMYVEFVEKIKERLKEEENDG